MATNLRIGAIIDFDWGGHIFNATIAMLNDPDDGMWDDLLDNETQIETVLVNDTCDEFAALNLYWNDIRSKLNPAHVVIGCECSGPTARVAQIAGLESVPVISMSSSSYRLSKPEFKNVFRMVAPDDERGQVGALVALFKSFGWNRVSMIGTDTEYSRDMVNKFGEAWTGDIAYSDIISVWPNQSVMDDSVIQSLKGVPTDNPATNSRVIVLIALEDNALRILELAMKMAFQPDTIWIASDGWVDRILHADLPWLPPIPGYLGLLPEKDETRSEYIDFLEAYNIYLLAQGHSQVRELPIYAGETVDAILAAVHALKNLSPSERENGTAVIEQLHATNFSFDGVTGTVTFDQSGRFRNSVRYGVINRQKDRWRTIPGIVTPERVDIEQNSICWVSGCNRTEPPSDMYEVPREIWYLILIPLIAGFVIVFGGLWLRNRMKVQEMQSKLNAIDNIDEQLATIGERVKEQKELEQKLLQQREGLQEIPDTWSTSQDVLVEVFPKDEQYWSVTGKLRGSMSDAWISRLWRIQNKSLWTYYSFHKSRLERHDIDPNEHSVWHGTKFIEPSVIHSDTQDGFMMQFSRPGLWGRGIYFANKSSYSDRYSYQVEPSVGNEREMFLAKLLVGNAVEMQRDTPERESLCESLTVPPVNPLTGLKYNTVTGWTSGSHVYVVYENGRAYPDYLVRYYRGKRDQARTPYADRAGALSISSASSHRRSFPGKVVAKESPRTVALPPIPPTKGANVTWEFEDNGWYPFALPVQVPIESAYQAYKSGVSPSSTHQYERLPWTYEVDFDTMRQTNIKHKSHTQRAVRRRET